MARDPGLPVLPRWKTASVGSLAETTVGISPSPNTSIPTPGDPMRGRPLQTRFCVPVSGRRSPGGHTNVCATALWRALLLFWERVHGSTMQDRKSRRLKLRAKGHQVPSPVLPRR